MTKTLVETMYAVASDYKVNIAVGFSNTIVQVTSNKNPKVSKSSVTYVCDLPTADKRDEYLAEEVAKLVEKVKAEE